jgi:hypothetical protein
VEVEIRGYHSNAAASMLRCDPAVGFASFQYAARFRREQAEGSCELMIRVGGAATRVSGERIAHRVIAYHYGGVDAEAFLFSKVRFHI